MNEIDYESFFSDYLDEGYRPRTSYEVPELPPIENTLSTSASLADHLDWQLRMTSMDAKRLERSAKPSSATSTSTDICRRRSKSSVEMGQYAARKRSKPRSASCRSFDPVGVGARDLKECLIIQLRRLDLGETPLETMVSEHLDLLAEPSVQRDRERR